MQLTMNQAIFYSLVFFSFAAPISIAGQSIATVLALLLAIIDLVRQRRVPEIPWTYFTGIGVFFLMLLISSIFSLQPAHSFHFLWVYISRFLLVFVIIWYIKTKEQVSTLFIAAALGWIIADIYAILQWLRGAERAVGFYSHPMMFGDCLTIAVPLFFAQLLGAGEPKKKVLMTTAFLLTAFALLANGSRGAWLAMLAIPVVLLATDRRTLLNKRSIIIFALILIIGFIGITTNNHFMERITSIGDMGYASNYNRIFLWQSAIHLWKDHPFTGVGLGNYENYFQTYLDPRSEFYGSKANAHNIYFQMLAEHGTLGPIVYLFMIYTLVKTHYRLAKQTNQKWLKAVALGAVMFTVTLALQGFVEYNLAMATVSRQFWFWTAVAFAAYKIEVNVR